jgi:phosphoribosylanthranilate isomerase
VTHIKFCGMTRTEDLVAAAELGVSAVGFVLVPQSPRFVRARVAAHLRAKLPASLTVVALFQNAESKLVETSIEALKPDVLQFHGDESAAFCAGFGVPYWKAVSMRPPPDLAALAREYEGAAALLLDSHPAGALGGTGQRFDWNAVAPIDTPIVLAGGLDAGNVGAAIRRVKPYAVDVSSGIERAPGVKDSAKMRDFVEAVRAADRG